MINDNINIGYTHIIDYLDYVEIDYLQVSKKSMDPFITICENGGVEVIDFYNYKYGNINQNSSR